MGTKVGLARGPVLAEEAAVRLFARVNASVDGKRALLGAAVCRCEKVLGQGFGGWGEGGGGGGQPI
jgi:hypothetical protein